MGRRLSSFKLVFRTVTSNRDGGRKVNCEIHGMHKKESAKLLGTLFTTGFSKVEDLAIPARLATGKYGGSVNHEGHGTAGTSIDREGRECFKVVNCRGYAPCSLPRTQRRPGHYVETAPGRLF